LLCTAALSTLSLHDALPILRQLRRAVYQCGDEPNDDEIRNKRAGDAQQRRKDAQSVLAVPPFCQLCQPRGGRALWLNFLHGKLLDRKSTRLNSSHVSISYAV